jgi:hypothetical protein
VKTANVLLVTLALFLICFSNGNAQSTANGLPDQLAKIATANLPGYLEPLTSGFGASMNSGFYHSADLHSILGFDIGLKVGVTMLKDENKTFNFVMPTKLQFGAFTLNAGVDYDPIVSSPTAVGNAKGVDVKLKSTSAYYNAGTANSVIFRTPDGYDFAFPGAPFTGVPAGAIQAAVGLPLGFEVMGRFIPTVSAGDAGKIGLTGFGLRHSIDQYLPLFPINIAVHFMTQKLTLNDKNDNKVFSASATAYGIEASKSLIFLTLYGGFQLESSSFTIEPYKYTDPLTSTSVTLNGMSIDGAKKSRVHAGVRFLLLFINLHADYAFSSTYPVATIGAGITFR